MLRRMQGLEGPILIMNGCSIMICSPGFVRFNQVLPLTCLRQKWYTKIVQMLICQPVVMVRTKETSLLIHSSRTHIMQGHLKLVACQASIRRYYQMQDFSEYITDVLVNSWIPATQKQYTVYIKKWAIFCGTSKIAPFSPDLSNVLEFLYT